jgi:glycosyltransferase involved in cell wall biosynthesis
MEALTRAWHRGDPKIRVLPFLDDSGEMPSQTVITHDFIYVADGEAHKNHRNLLAAWTLLAAEDIRPSLALTLDARFKNLIDDIAAACLRHQLKIINLGTMSRAELLRLYAACGALIFPSTSESFGLPLIEASRIGLPIVAAELDYVRDVCEPIQTFDPKSPNSMARAVRRFLGVAEQRHHVRSAKEFLAELVG